MSVYCVSGHYKPCELLKFCWNSSFRDKDYLYDCRTSLVPFFQIMYTIYSKIMSLLQKLHLSRSKEKIAIVRLLCINTGIVYCYLTVHLFCERSRNITLTFWFPVKYICICCLIRWFAFFLLLLTTVITINNHSEVREVIIFEGHRRVSNKNYCFLQWIHQWENDT